MEGIVECCISNMDNRELDTLAQSGLNVKERTCLEHCGICLNQPIMTVNGIPVTGESYEDLVEKVDR